MDFAAALIEQNEAFAETLRGADPATPVPTCPGWTLKHLLRHVGRGDRWAAQIIGDRLTGYLDPREVRNGKPPDDADGTIDWLRGGAQCLVEAVDRVGADTPVWTFLGPRPATWWIRRRLHEATVHRADAELALGRAFRLSAELAADGLTEWLERVVAQSGEDQPPLRDGQTLHLHATDGGDWTLRGNSDALALDRSPADASAVCSSRKRSSVPSALRASGSSVPSALRASGSSVPSALRASGSSLATVGGDVTSLFLAVVRRIPPDDSRIAISGDADVWRAWLDHTPF